MAAALLSDRNGPDMITIPIHLNPTMFGVPQCRNRLWILSTARRCCVDSHGGEEEVLARVKCLFSRLVGGEGIPLDQYLLPESDALLSLGRRHFEMAPDTAKRRRVDPVGWGLRHEAAFRAAGRPWCSADDAPCPRTVECYPTLRALTVRETDVLRFLGISFPELTPRTVDVSQNIARAKVGVSLVGCLTAGARVYLSHRCRLLLGVEALRLQSFFHPDPGRLLAFDDRLLRDLAGNAFEASCCAASLLVVLLVLSRGAEARSKTGDIVPGDSGDSVPGDEAACPRSPRGPREHDPSPTLPRVSREPGPQSGSRRSTDGALLEAMWGRERKGRATEGPQRALSGSRGPEQNR